MALSRGIPEIALGAIVLPSARILLCGEVPSLEVFERLKPDINMWIRWVEPGGNGPEDPRIEIAAGRPSDTHGEAATVVARSRALESRTARIMFDLAEPMALVDLVIVERADPGATPAKLMNWIACVESPRFKDKIRAILMPPHSET